MMAILFFMIASLVAVTAAAQDGTANPGAVGFQLPEAWEYTAPLVDPEPRAEQPSHAQKDPTVVHHEGRWHLFITVKLPNRTAIEYCSFENWEEANASKRTLLTVSESDYFCAPQVFYFTPHRLWYLVYQVAWTPIADTFERPFASARNIRPAAGVAPWTDNVSHGELIRDGVDQTLVVDPANLRFVFQGMLESEKVGKGYGAFPWRIGMLTPATESR